MKLDRLIPCALVLAIPITARAEMAAYGNPAVLEDHSGLRVNPALAVWQPVAFEVTWKLLHTGLADSPAAFGQGGFSFSIPRWNLALLALHRDTDLMNESEIALDWAYRPLGNLSLGLELGFRHFGWNTSRFSEGVTEDPVFRNGSDRIQPVLGAGVFWSPLGGLRLGLGLKHINRPSLALSGSEPRAPLREYLGLHWSGGPLRLGLTLDNLAYNRSDGGLLDELIEEPRPGLEAGYRVLPGVELAGRVREEGFALSMSAAWEEHHSCSYELTFPIGDFADRAGSSHRLVYRLDLGGGLSPGRFGPAGGPGVYAPGETSLGRGGLRGLFGRRWDAARAPVLMALPRATVDLMELHLHLPQELADEIPLESVLAAQLPEGERVVPQGGEVVRETYSREYYRLTALLETMARERGVVPVIHAGERSMRIEDLAALSGAPVEARVGARRALPPSGSTIPVPENLELRVLLDDDFAGHVSAWRLVFRGAGGHTSRVEGAGAPPERLLLPVYDDRGGLPDAGTGRVDLLLFDSSGVAVGEEHSEVHVVHRVRHVHLRALDPAEELPPGVDGIHIIMQE